MKRDVFIVTIIVVLLAADILILLFFYPVSFEMGNGNMANDNFKSDIHLGNGLIAHYSSDKENGTVLQDVSGNGLNGTLQGDTTWVDGRWGKALYFDGDGDYVEIPSSANPGEGAFTVTFWVKTTSTQSGRLVCYDSNTSTYGTGGDWSISFNDSGSGGVRFFYRGASTVNLDSNTAINDGKWYFIVAIRDPLNGTRKIYINGVLNAEISSGDTYTASGSNSPVTIGGETSDSWETDYFNGSIDEVRIYNRPLTKYEIDFLYNYSDMSDAIIINGNDEFASMADERGWGGDGSEGNPYVIDGYYIDASGGSYGVYIQNTDVHFELRNSYIGNFSSSGIYFYSLSNGTVIDTNAPNSPSCGVYIDSSNNVTLSDVSMPYSYYALYLYGSRDVTVDGGNFSHSEYGVYMEYADHNVIQNSNFSHTSDYGIYFYDASSCNYFYSNDVSYSSYYAVYIYDDYSVNNTFKRNDFSHSGDTAVYIEDAEYTRLIENTILTDYLSVEINDAPHTTLYGNVMGKNGIWMEDVFSNHNITDNNTVDGRPVYYYKNVNMNNASVPSDAGQVILGNVSYLRVENLNFTGLNYTSGIIIGESHYIYIENNSMEDDKYGIYMEESNHSYIKNNTIVGGDSGYYGRFCSNITIRDNRFSGSGIYAYDSSYMRIINNTVENSKDRGIYLNYGDHNTLEWNNVSNSADDGIKIYYGFNRLSNNTVENNGGVGIYIPVSGNFNEVYNNTVKGDGEQGIYLSGGNGNNIQGNDVENNSGEGIYLYQCTGTEVGNNTISHNSIGIYLDGGSENDITNNTILSDGNYSIYLQLSQEDFLYGNEISGGLIGLPTSGSVGMEYFTTHRMSNNTVDGRPVYYYSNVDMNNASVPSYAGEILLANVSFLKIEGLDLHSDVNLSGSWVGLYYSRYIYIGNSTLNNAQYGIYIYATSHSRIYNNSIGNGTYGIYITGSGASNTVNNGMSFSNEIIWNNINNNTNYGVSIPSSTFAFSNEIYNNSFYYNHGSTGTYDANHVQAYCEPGGGVFDDGKYGNYWYDWANNNDTNDENGDGIVDWPYILDGGNKDNYPLKSSEVAVPEMSILWLIVPMLALLLVRRRLRERI